MSKIKIQNFGAIRQGYQEDEGWLDIKKVTVFIGNQGSGKSTVAKLISTFTWIEKALVRGDYPKKWFERKNKLKNQLLNFHRLENYFQSLENQDTKIYYQGEAYHISYEKEQLFIEEIEHKNYDLPQIMYVPAERNFISYVRTPKELKLSSASLKEFLTEFDNAKVVLKGLLKLPINDTELEYDKLNDVLKVKGSSYKIKLTEASSGFQSFVPLYLVSYHLAHSVKKQSSANKEPMSGEQMQRFRKGVEDIWNNHNLTDEQKKIALSALSSKFNKTSFVNIVEEPEQNLYPTSQQKMLNALLEFNNLSSNNKLILTTHSPYLINYLTLAAKGTHLKNKIKDSILLNKIFKIIPENSMVRGQDIAIYQLEEQTGIIRKLQAYNGLPSDLHELNLLLDESNEFFAQLLEIQQKYEH
ncbi:AAA family ATPase [Hugenholtzia roseola]|uniref:AAA family ATPase n=1 Tax=Hugenholtzia roseola TaxID=1002 RepID=UPI00041D0776|nr:AAA family ATPase [Hugenholtzia roseola]